MRLKTYQQNTLDTLQKFFETCRIVGAREAYRQITNDAEIAARLGKLRGDYVCWDSIPNTPRVCLKVPTGGGKTIIAAHAVKVVSDTWCERENPLVLWFCPSDTIRRQTSEALKNPRHPYRVALDEQFGGRVRIFDIDEKFNIRPADIENGVCIIVSTIQAFRQGSTDKYNVYRHNEDLEPHFTHIAAAGGMEKDERGNLKFSFANLLYHHRPVVIVDEAHNVISGLSQETQGRINPSALVELTATPQVNNNTLYNVRASELKEEEMIKLPIELREHLGWEHAVDEAILKRAELEKLAEDETEYVRPILLFQAQDKNGEINVDALKTYLVDTANIPVNEIAIATGEQKELDGVNVFARDCPIKYIITVEALKEGWDCSFAYVLCSLANVQSNTAVEQLLGRVMRMPYAKARSNAALNKAYAYVLSKKFGEAAGAIVKKLKDRGFDDNEALASVEEKPSELFGGGEHDKVELSEPLILTAVPQTIRVEDDGKTLVFTSETTDDDIERLIEQAAPAAGVAIRYKYENYKRTPPAAPSPAELGERFTVPKMLVALQGELEFIEADPEDIFAAYSWDIAAYADPKLEKHEFSIEPQGNGFVINLDGNDLKFSQSGEQLSLPFVEVENWTAANLIYWLDRKLRQDDIPQPQMVEWLRKMIKHLTETRGMNLSALMTAKYALASKVETKIKAARNKARKAAYQTSMFGREARVKLDYNDGFEFFNGMYSDVGLHYRGSYTFKKHFLSAREIPMIDGGEKGEEFACAQALDRELHVKYWVRNVARHKNSFWLTTSTDKFYPDFVAMLNDGRILVVEYKGAHLASSDDTEDKRVVGELMEKQSGGKILFMVAVKEDEDGRDVAEQVKGKIGGIVG